MHINANEKLQKMEMCDMDTEMLHCTFIILYRGSSSCNIFPSFKDLRTGYGLDTINCI